VDSPQAIRHNFDWLSSALCECGGLLARNRLTAFGAKECSKQSCQLLMELADLYGTIGGGRVRQAQT